MSNRKRDIQNSDEDEDDDLATPLNEDYEPLGPNPHIHTFFYNGMFDTAKFNTKKKWMLPSQMYWPMFCT